MKEKQSLNCVGFVYTVLGFQAEEKYVEPPSLDILLKKFDRVKDITYASILAVIVYSSRKPYVGHIALINEDRNTITHRKLGQDISTEKIETALEEFTHSDLDFRRIIYLTPKH